MTRPGLGCEIGPHHLSSWLYYSGLQGFSRVGKLVSFHDPILGVVLS